MWTELGEIIKAVAPAITATAAAIGAYVGVKGINKWQAEAIGKKKIDLAEDVLAAFYDARDRIKFIRAVEGYAHEGEERKAPEGESNFQKRERDAAFVPLARYENHRQFFSELMAKRYRLRAQIGPRVDQPFNELQSVISKILTAARMLMRTAGARTESSEPLRKEWLAAIYEMDNDPISTRIDAAISDLEKVCQPILEGKGHR